MPTDRQREEAKTAAAQKGSGTLFDFGEPEESMSEWIVRVRKSKHLFEYLYYSDDFPEITEGVILWTNLSKGVPVAVTVKGPYSFFVNDKEATSLSGAAKIAIDANYYPDGWRLVAFSGKLNSKERDVEPTLHYQSMNDYFVSVLEAKKIDRSLFENEEDLKTEISSMKAESNE